MNRINLLLVNAMVFIMLGCSEAEKSYPVENNTSNSLSKVNTENFDEFPFYNIPQWRYDLAKYQGPYSESGEYYQEKNIIAPLLQETL